MATATIALLAGGSYLTSFRLGLAMLALQFSLGSLNDLVDAPRDAGAKTGKPIPAGAVRPTEARTVWIISQLLGVALSLPSGMATTVLALLGYGSGLAYDLRLKGTAWSWLPFAAGIPLLPVYAWLGAVGEVPSWFVILVPAAFAAGAALAIANTLADVERDRAVGVSSVALALGPATAWRAHVLLHGAVIVVALGSLVWRVGVPAGSPGPGAAVVGALIGSALVIGVGCLLANDPRPARRERGWELEAVGVGLLAASWVAGMTGALG